MISPPNGSAALRKCARVGSSATRTNAEVSFAKLLAKASKLGSATSMSSPVPIVPPTALPPMAPARAPPGPARAKKAVEPVEVEAPVVEAESAVVVPAEAPAEVDATDTARSLAEENGIDLATIEGTGKEGRILKSDVAKAIKAREGK